MIQHLGYLGVFIALFLEAVGVPFPSETILITTGIEMTRGVFSFLPLWLAGAFGNILGSNLAYLVGRFLGRVVILRYGRRVGITERRLLTVERQLDRYQIPFVFITKFIAFVRIVVPYLAGINKMRYGLFTLVNTLSALAWSCFFILIGRTLEDVWHRFSHYLVVHLYVSIPAAFLILAGFYWLHKRSRRFFEPEQKTGTLESPPEKPSQT